MCCRSTTSIHDAMHKASMYSDADSSTDLEDFLSKTSSSIRRLSIMYPTKLTDVLEVNPGSHKQDRKNCLSFS